MPDTIPLEEMLSWIQDQQPKPASPLEAQMRYANHDAARILNQLHLRPYGQRLHFPSAALPPLD